ncbi:MAG: hypothetical protein ACE14P_01030 [Methanotrichaceae archaeon]
MHVPRSMVILCLLAQSITLASAGDLTGTWTSTYSFGSIQEVMTANVQQVGGDILGSFTVNPSTGSPYSGILFGRIEGDNIKVNYLSIKSSLVTITFADAKATDQNTIKGTYYVQDSDMNAISGFYEAKRK